MPGTTRLRAVTTVLNAADHAARAAVAARTEALFRRSGALTEGHFQLKSGRHSERYLEKFLVLQDPAATSELCGYWAAAYRAPDGTPTADVVAGPTTGGVILAFETARQLGIRGIFAEEVTGARRDEAARVPARLPDRARRAGRCSSTTSSRPAARCSRCCRRSRRPVARSSAATSSSTGAAGSRR